MNVIFLDIDGVVNTLMIYKEKPEYLKDLKMVERDGYFFELCSPSDLRVSNYQAVQWLDYVCHLYNLKIVITSTWRLGHYEEAKQALYNSGLSNTVEVIGSTPVSEKHHRGKEIQEYLNSHPDISEFIILDDDIADIDPYMRHLVKTNTYEGITYKIFIDCLNKLREFGIERP